jgi:hypothetical protein
MTPAQLGSIFVRRTGADLTPAVRLMLLAASPQAPPLETARFLLLRTPSADVLDGLVQHPKTRDYLGERLGPTTVVVPERAREDLRRALEKLGLRLPEAGE